MKKSLKILVSGLVALSLCTGCSNPFSSSKEPVVLTANLFEDNGITEEQEINVGRCEDLFVESLAAAIKNPNITIRMNFTSSYGEDEKLMNDINLKLDYDDEKKSASVDVLTNNSGTETKEKQYYKDGYFYISTAEGKQKVEEDFSQFLYQSDGYSMPIESSIISKFACVEHDGIKTYYMQYDPIGYENNIITNMEAASQPLEQDESIKVNYANVIFDIDENNVMLSYRFVTDTDHTLSGETNNSVADMKVDFYDIGSTKVDEPEDPDSYEEVVPEEDNQAQSEEASQTVN